MSRDRIEREVSEMELVERDELEVSSVKQVSGEIL